MKKNIIGITTLSAIAVSLVPSSASAIYIPPTSLEEIQEQLEDYTYITEFIAQKNDPNHNGDYQLYIRIPEEADTDKFCEVKVVTKENYDTVKITLTDGNGRKLLADAMLELGINGKVFTDDDMNCECRLYGNTSEADVRKLYQSLNDKGIITEFVYTTDLYSIQVGGTNNELLGSFGFCAFDYETHQWTSQEEQLANYERLVKLADELLPDCTVELNATEDKELGFTAYYASVLPSITMTIKERIDFALKFKEETGIFGTYFINEAAAPVFGTYSVDYLNAIVGDANCDEGVDMADVVLIMQSLANPDKYSLTPQGRFNGDMADPGDGITLGDALAIQEILLNN